jgi:hypothetical protein
LTVRHLHILCEGQTDVTLSIFTTKRPVGGPAFKGGLSQWPKLERELRLLLHDSSITVLTSMRDYYAFPSDAPGMADRPYGSPQQQECAGTGQRRRGYRAVEADHECVPAVQENG